MSSSKSITPDDVPTDWEARFRADDAPWERGDCHPAISDWQAGGLLRGGQSIFVPGCGRSLEPDAFARMGLEVTGLDVAQSAVDWQSRHFETNGLEGRFLLENALTWRPETGFDLYYEQTFLCAIHPHQRIAYEIAAYAQIKPGGHLLALFMQKKARGGPPYGCAMDAMRALFDDRRWIWPGTAPIAYPHPHLNDKAELAVILTRRPG